MVNFMGRIENAAVSVCLGLMDTGIMLQKGVLAVLEEGSLIMHDIYSLEGFEKWDKALIANLKFLSLLPGVQGTFDKALVTFEAQKDLYYATMFIGSMADFIEVTRNATTGLKSYSFTFPKLKDKKNVDLVKIFYAMGNFCETGKFFQKYNIYAFPLCTRFSNCVGSYKFYKNYTLDDIPVFNSFLDKPKDFFIFLASWVEIYRCLNKEDDEPILEWENILKFTGSVGKILLISLGRKFSKQWWFLAIDFTTQNASLAAFILKRHRTREEKFFSPGAAPAA